MGEAGSDNPTVEGLEGNSAQSISVSALKGNLALYRKIISRYSRDIAAGEQKTVPELKALVNPKDPAIQASKLKILSELGITQYSSERDFTAFSPKAHAFVQSLLPLHSDLSVPFWLTPAEMLELGAADVFDRAVFLCSLLASAGCSSATIAVLELEGDIIHPVVTYVQEGRTYVEDPAEFGGVLSVAARGLKESLPEFSYQGKRAVRVLYEFNSQEYSEVD